MPLLKGTGNCREDDIRRLAYEIYLARISRGEPGDEKQDWLEAERQLNTEVQLARAVEWVGQPYGCWAALVTANSFSSPRLGREMRTSEERRATPIRRTQRWRGEENRWHRRASFCKNN